MWLVNAPHSIANYSHRYQDAERDSSSTLEIQKDNVKALFRRGLARTHLENFEGSQDGKTPFPARIFFLRPLYLDLLRALKLEPGNPSIKEELEKVKALMLEHAKRFKPALTIPPAPKPRTRRVPIQVVDIPPTQSDLLTPVSSRPLNRSLTTTPVSETPENKHPEQKSPQSTSQETNQTRSTRYGGGIFRSSGSHTIFKSEPPSAAPHTKPQMDQPPRPAMNLAAFTRSWNTLATDNHKWTLLQQIPPVSLSRFFGSSFEAEILSSILGVLLTVLSSGTSERSLVKEYMVYLPQVPRFFLIYTFLRRGDKDRAKEIWTLLDYVGVTSEEDENTKKSWDV